MLYVKIYDIGKYSVVQKNSCMFEFTASFLPANPGQPMHSPTAVMENVSPNLAGIVLLHAVHTVYQQILNDYPLTHNCPSTRCTDTSPLASPSESPSRAITP